MEIDQFWMVELIHDWDLILDSVLVKWIGCVDKFGHKHTPRCFLNTAMDNTKSSTVTQTQESIV